MHILLNEFLVFNQGWNLYFTVQTVNENKL